MCSINKIWLFLFVIQFCGWPQGNSSDVAQFRSPLLNHDIRYVAESLIPHASIDIALLEKTLEKIKMYFYNHTVSVQYIEEMKNTNTTMNCMKSIVSMILHRKSSFVLKMFDSWGKPESGALQGNVRWGGRYFECQSAITNLTDGYGSKWCSVNIGGHSIAQGGKFIGFMTGITIGVCLPDTCSAKNISWLFTKISGLNSTTFCPPESHLWSNVDSVTFILIVIFVCLAILGTIYHFYKEEASNLQEHISIKNHEDDDELLVPVSDEPVGKSKNDSASTRIMMSFSLTKNTLSILNMESKEGHIDCIHGLRFISMTWVILVHTFVFSLSTIDNVVDFADYMINNFSYLALLSGSFSVDTFFFLSGALLTYLTLKKMAQNNGQLNIPMMYLYRYLRLTPLYAFCILFSVSLYTYLGSGPFWTTAGSSLTNTCHKYWWTNLLYMNNLYPFDILDECFSWSWYLANDMQFYLLSPFFLFLLNRKPKAGMVALCVGIFTSILVTGIISSYYNEQPMALQYAQIAHLITNAVSPKNTNSNFAGNGNATGSQTDKFASDIYVRPWCRIAVYFIGMIVGYILNVYQGRIKINKLVVVAGWFVTTVLDLTLIYGYYYYVHSGDLMPCNLSAFYNAVSRPLWALGLAWVVIACVGGYGGPVNRFLSWKIFFPLSRLTYGTYLVHPLVLFLVYSTQETGHHFNILTSVCYFLAVVIISNCVAYIITILIELPIMNVVHATMVESKEEEVKQQPIITPQPQTSTVTDDENVLMD